MIVNPSMLGFNYHIQQDGSIDLPMHWDKKTFNYKSPYMQCSYITVLTSYLALKYNLLEQNFRCLAIPRIYEIFKCVIISSAVLNV